MVGMYKGYDVYISFTKWRISKDTVQRPEKFSGYFEAIEFIDKHLEKRTMGIKKFVFHAESIKTMKMKSLFLTMVGHKQVEKNISISALIYVRCGDFLLIVPFIYMEEGKITKKGINLYNFIQQNKLKNIKEIFRKEVTILDGKITKNNLTIYDCTDMDWEKILSKKVYYNMLKGREFMTCPLDN